MSNPTLKTGVSIIIPSYRPNKYLARLLESITNQKRLGDSFLEVIVIINGRNSFEVEVLNQQIDRLKEKHQVRVLYNSDGNVSKARNLGIGASSREFITFCDDDDWIGSKYIAELYKIAEHTNIACAPIVNITNDNKDYNSLVNTFLDTSLENKLGAYSRVITLSACKLLPTENVKTIKFDEKLVSGEDIVYFSSYVSKFKPQFVHVEGKDSYYHRFVTDTSVSRQLLSYDFNVEQRLDVIERLVKIDSEYIGWLQTKVDGQLSFINKYYASHPESVNRIRGAFSKRSLAKLVTIKNDKFNLHLSGKKL